MVQPLYSDLSLELDTPTVVNREAIEQAIINLFSTGKGERTFQPEIQGSLDDLLFDIVNDFTAFSLRHRIFESIERWDSRVTVDNALSFVTPDPDEGRYYVELVLNIRGHYEDKSLISLYVNRT